jgi:hypothetical protein
VYRRLVEWTTVWEEEGLSRAAITPGHTMPDDVHWWWCRGIQFFVPRQTEWLLIPGG